MFDSREYGFTDLTLLLGGKDIVSIQGIMWKKRVAKKVIHGKGKKGRKIQRGEEYYEIKVIMLQSDYEVLCANDTTGEGCATNLRLDAILSYGDPSKGDALMTRFFKDIEFTEEGEDWKQGDMLAEIELPGICLDIKREVA